MKADKERLARLLQEKKISEEEYQLLVSALPSKKTKLDKIFSYLINPFQHLANSKALVWGLLIMVAMSLISLSYPTVPGGLHLSFFRILLLNLAAWLLLAFIFFTLASLVQRKVLALENFLSTFAFSYYPFLFFMLVLRLCLYLNPAIIASVQDHKFDFMTASYSTYLLGIIGLLSLVWYYLVLFHAIKKSSGLFGGKLGALFIGGMVLDYFVTPFLGKLLY